MNTGSNDSDEAIMVDIKKEFWPPATVGADKQAGSYGPCFEPIALTPSMRWNPLDAIRVGTEYEIGDVQHLANLLRDPNGCDRGSS